LLYDDDDDNDDNDDDEKELQRTHTKLFPYFIVLSTGKTHGEYVYVFGGFWGWQQAGRCGRWVGD
jgi:hypothetical protein